MAIISNRLIWKSEDFNRQNILSSSIKGRSRLIPGSTVQSSECRLQAVSAHQGDETLTITEVNQPKQQNITGRNSLVKIEIVLQPLFFLLSYKNDLIHTLSSNFTVLPLKNEQPCQQTTHRGWKNTISITTPLQHLEKFQFIWTIMKLFTQAHDRVHATFAQQCSGLNDSISITTCYDNDVSGPPLWDIMWTRSPMC